MITIYGLDGCAACQRAVDICEQYGQKYKYYLATSNKVAEFTEDTVAPFILIDDAYIGSVEHLITYLEVIQDRLDALKVYLKDDVHIEFLKVDGTSRTIHCTQNLDKIPVEHRPPEKSEPEEAEQGNWKPTKPKDKFLLKVFDLEANGWRSIRGERILRFS